jgi:UDP-N-acetylmuramate: L-alanyl-gamma-D-glutamyl-meso-diaminopimelate ligase
MRFTVVEADGATFELELGVWGAHNATNALAVWAAARHDGLPPAEVGRALAGFRGVRRRQEVLGTVAGVTVVDDFAHHPTAVGKTLEALRDRFPGRRLIACFEPRSLTAGRAFFLAGYRAAFRAADHTLFAPLFHRDRLAPAERLDLALLAGELAAAGAAAEAAATIDELLARVLELVRPGDVVVTMSSGSFAGLAGRLVEALAPAASPPAS